MRACLLGLFSFLTFLTLSQTTFFTPSDTLNKKRTLASSGITGGLAIGSIIGLASVWYADYEKTPLHSFDDSKNWLQMDKVGHAYACYHFSELSSKLFRWSGLSPKTSAFIGTSIGWGYQFGIELLDGKSSGWGFSWSDLAANSIGSLLFLSQELIFEKQILKFKFSYSPSPYAQYRPSVLGSNFNERLLKDYNAQSYWLTFSPFQFVKNSKMKWLSLALGYSVDAKLVGDQEYYQTADGLHEFFSKREWLLSLDIDVKELPIKKKWLKVALAPFNSIKIPFPSLLWRGGTCYGSF
jgi:hypothetical protein